MDTILHANAHTHTHTPVQKQSVTGFDETHLPCTIINI